jgi:chromosome segregation ATPase
MSPMADHPLTFAELEQFYRDVFLPDFRRIVEEAFGRVVRRLPSQVDLISSWLTLLEKDYGFLQADLTRIEARLDWMEEWLHRLGARFDHPEDRRDIRERWQAVLDTTQRLDARLSRTEGQVDALIAGGDKERLRSEVADFRGRVALLQAQARSLEPRLDR